MGVYCPTREKPAPTLNGGHAAPLGFDYFMLLDTLLLNKGEAPDLFAISGFINSDPDPVTKW
jgi:hypothetical protein